MSRTPTLETLQQSLREVESGIVEKQDLLEDLTMRIKAIRLSTPGGRSSYAPRPSIAPPATKTATLDIPADVSAEVERQLDRADKRSSTKLKTTPRVAPSSRAIKRSVVQVGALPLPSKIDISSFIRQDEPVVKQEPNTPISTPEIDLRVKPNPAPAPSAPTLPPSFNLNIPPPAPVSDSGTGSGPASPFGSFKLSLDPGDLSSSHSRGRASTPGTRTHHAAPRVSLNTTTSEDKGTGTTAPAVSFFPPPGTSMGQDSGTGGAGKGSPKGFFSLSGFGQK